MTIVQERAGVNVGKGFHRAHVVDASETESLSCGDENDEADLLALVGEALSLAEDVARAVDRSGGGAALLLALPRERDRGVFYAPGLGVDRVRDGYRGEPEMDQGRVRRRRPSKDARDLGRLEHGDDALAGLELLLARRRDLVADRNRRAVTRLGE